MKPALWRAIVLPIILVAALFVALGPLVQIERDDLGMSYTPTISLLYVVPRAITPGSPAARTGIHAGDRVQLAVHDLSDRIAFMFPVPGVKIPVIVNGTRRVTLVAGPAQPVSFGATLEFNIVRLAFLLIAALLAWRRPEDRTSRALVAFLFLLGLGIALNNHAFGSPTLTLLVLALPSVPLVLYGIGAGARFAAIFPTGSAPRAAQGLANATMLVALLGSVTFFIVSLFDVRSRAYGVFSSFAVLSSFLLSLMLLAATLVERYIHAPALERRRRLWIFLILSVGLLGPAVDISVTLITGHFNQLVDQYGTLTFMVIPIGLAYIILRHRVIDVGFVLNRAAVYAVVSIFIVGVFVVVETLLAKYVETTSHVTSTAVQLAVALGLGFSIRAIHARADRFVDTVLFRERHEAEQAIRDFARDATYITESHILLQRSVKVICRFGGAKRAGIWLRQDGAPYTLSDGTFERLDVDPNDPALVAMRSRRVVVDLPAAESQLPGLLGFPMIVRGELIGVLVCDAKQDEETYAPDERDAIAAVATSVGHALDALRVADLEATVHQLLTLQGGGATQGAIETF